MTRSLLVLCVTLAALCAFLGWRGTVARRDAYLLRESIAAQSDTLRTVTETAKTMRAREASQETLVGMLRADLASALKRSGGTVRGVSLVTVEARPETLTTVLRDTVQIVRGDTLTAWTFFAHPGRYTASGTVFPLDRRMDIAVTQQPIVLSVILTERRGGVYEVIADTGDSSLIVTGIVAKVNPFRASWFSRHRGLLSGIVGAATVALIRR